MVEHGWATRVLSEIAAARAAIAASYLRLWGSETEREVASGGRPGGDRREPAAPPEPGPETPRRPPP
jgi:hypothetical protein